MAYILATDCEALLCCCHQSKCLCVWNGQLFGTNLKAKLLPVHNLSCTVILKWYFNWNDKLGYVAYKQTKFSADSKFCIFKN